jgi:predicted transcriptional regulator YheO
MHDIPKWLKEFIWIDSFSWPELDSQLKCCWDLRSLRKYIRWFGSLVSLWCLNFDHAQLSRYETHITKRFMQITINLRKSLTFNLRMQKKINHSLIKSTWALYDHIIIMSVNNQHHSNPPTRIELMTAITPNSLNQILF